MKPEIDCDKVTIDKVWQGEGLVKISQKVWHTLWTAPNIKTILDDFKKETKLGYKSKISSQWCGRQTRVIDPNEL